jgi:superfamily I DNA/RNA helicase
MEMTKEQLAIIHSTGNIKINAVAGSGKTTTVIEYAKARPQDSRILYLAFNKSVKLEAIDRFAAARLHNVKVETAHSLAYRHIVFKHNYKVRPQGYKTHEVAELLGLQTKGDKHAVYIAANHISKFIAYFCNSSKARVSELNYLDVVSDEKAREFVTAFYDTIAAQARLLLGKMDKGEIECTHDFYLKKFQLSNPVLNYDYILFDEGQDASPAMLDVFLKQNAIKVIVGDTHQQIYSWRFAVNSLEQADFKTYLLSTSFRFGQDIARLAMEVLKWKGHLAAHPPVTVIGQGKTKAHAVKAVLARTNLGLLLRAIESVMGKNQVKRLYFEGNFNSYTYADDGTSLYDVLNLFNGRHRQIREKLIQGMKDLDELEDYIEQTEDMQLGMMVDIVKEYGNEIPRLIQLIKDRHVGNDEKARAEVIFSTVHRCKGMEYDEVHLVDDFLTEDKLVRLCDDAKKDARLAARLNEEINLLYVALTRTKNRLHIPEALLPKGFPGSAQIHIEATGKEKTPCGSKTTRTAPALSRADKPDRSTGKKTYSVDEARGKNTDAYRPWTPALDDELTEMYCERVRIKAMAKHFGRTTGAIRARIKKLELEEAYG